MERLPTGFFTVFFCMCMDLVTFNVKLAQKRVRCNSVQERARISMVARYHDLDVLSQPWVSSNLQQPHLRQAYLASSKPGNPGSLFKKLTLDNQFELEYDERHLRPQSGDYCRCSMITCGCDAHPKARVPCFGRESDCNRSHCLSSGLHPLQIILVPCIGRRCNFSAVTYQGRTVAGDFPMRCRRVQHTGGRNDHELPLLDLVIVSTHSILSLHQLIRNLRGTSKMHLHKMR